MVRVGGSCAVKLIPPKNDLTTLIQLREQQVSFILHELTLNKTKHEQRLEGEGGGC